MVWDFVYLGILDILSAMIIVYFIAWFGSSFSFDERMREVFVPSSLPYGFVPVCGILPFLHLKVAYDKTSLHPEIIFVHDFQPFLWTFVL